MDFVLEFVNGVVVFVASCVFCYGSSGRVNSLIFNLKALLKTKDPPSRGMQRQYLGQTPKYNEIVSCK